MKWNLKEMQTKQFSFLGTIWNWADIYKLMTWQIENYKEAPLLFKKDFYDCSCNML